MNQRHSLTEPFAHLPRAHCSRWEQEQIRCNKKPFLTLSLNAAGKKYHFLRGKSICPGLHATENDYTAVQDRLSQAKPPAPWDAWAGAWSHTVLGNLGQRWGVRGNRLWTARPGRRHTLR